MATALNYVESVEDQLATGRHRMEALCESFPVLTGRPGTTPWDQHTFARWASGPAPTPASRQAAAFVLSVWNWGTPAEQPGLFRGDKWGLKYRKIIHRSVPWEEVAIDLFLVTPQSWGPQLAIRTGPAEFSRLLVTSVEHGGCMPAGHHMLGGHVIGPDKDFVPLREEREFFDLLGLPTWPPRQRCEYLLREHLDRNALVHPADTEAQRT